MKIEKKKFNPKNIDAKHSNGACAAMLCVCVTWISIFHNLWCGVKMSAATANLWKKIFSHVHKYIIWQVGGGGGLLWFVANFSTPHIQFFFCIFVICNFFFHTVRGSRPGKNVQLSEQEIRGLCLKSREIFLSQPILLELEAPLKICGKCFWQNDDHRK